MKNYRQSILKAVKYRRTNSRSRQMLCPPIDILDIDAKKFAEQLTYIDAVSTTSVSHTCMYMLAFEHL